MFKVGNFEAEIAKAMQTNLSQDLLKKQASQQKTARSLKIAKTVNQLDEAASTLDALGFHAMAEAITVVLEKMAGEKHEGTHEEPLVFEIEGLLKNEKSEDSDKDLGEQIIEMRSIASAILKKKVLNSNDNPKDSQSVKGDSFTENLTPNQMIKNLLETGTSFNYKDVDFRKIIEILKKHHNENDASMADDVEPKNSLTFEDEV